MRRICAYLGDAFPDAGLAPPSGRRGAYYRWLFFAAGPLEAAVTGRMFGFAVPADQESMVGYGNYATVMDTLEKAVAGEGYVAGESFSAADIYVGSHIGWGMQYGTVEKRPAFEAYWSRLSVRAAYQRGNALDDAAAASADKG